MHKFNPQVIKETCKYIFYWLGTSQYALDSHVRTFELNKFNHVESLATVELCFSGRTQFKALYPSTATPHTASKPDVVEITSS